MLCLYVRPLSDIFNRHDVHYHSYAESQMIPNYMFILNIVACTDSMREALLKLENWIKEISHWMSHSGLKLNKDTTEWIFLNGCDISENITLTVGAHNIAQSTHIRSLCVKLDAELTIESQITDMCKSAYYHNRRKITKIRKYLTDDTTKTLVHSLITCRLDYCNSL